jgi:IS605 OrfB family transposase
VSEAIIFKTYKYRVKSHTGFLNEQAKKVNFVFNYCNDTQRQAVKRGAKWLSGFDLINLTSGTSKLLELKSSTINSICLQYAKSRQQHNRPWLRWRSKKHTGWIPLKSVSLKIKGNDFVFSKKTFRVFKSRDIPSGAKIKDGSNFSQDSRGRWYLNLTLEIRQQSIADQTKEIGIDLGLKDFATMSNGDKYEGPKSTRFYAEKLAKAQRANKRRQALKIHDKIKNTRKDFHHKLSSKLVKDFGSIYVGDVSSLGLAKTKMAKSVLDAGWAAFRQMLTYKSVMNDVRYVEVNEAFSTQRCSTCGTVPESSPKGIAALGIREWVCSNCGSEHDRDVNAAKNILRYGQVSPVEGAFR